MDLHNSRCPARDLRACPAFYFVKKYEEEQRGNEGSPGRDKSRGEDFVCRWDLRKDRQDQE